MIVAVLAAMLAGPVGGPYGWMGGGPYYGWGGMWWVGPLVMAVVFLLVLWIVLLVGRALWRAAGAGPADPETVVRLRYARGEISAEEYQRLLVNLRTKP